MKVCTALFLTGFLFLGFTSGTSAQNPQWELVWSDEFTGNSLNTNYWSYQFGTGSTEGLSGWGNAELQYYTDRPQNVFVQDGHLHIVARREAYGGMEYTSARIRTINKADWRYGRVEIRAKMPQGRGIWPALWMMPTDAVYGRWPASGEIDIMELIGHEPNIIHGTIHYGPPHTFSGGAYTLPEGTFSDDFHVFALEWERDEMRWYVNDILYHTETNWFSAGQGFPAPFDQRFHLIFNVAVGGNWPGSPDASTVFPQQMIVDYVRVYQDANAPARVSMPLLFEDTNFDYDRAFTTGDGVTVSVIENPAPDDENRSNRVGKFVKDGAGEDAGLHFETERHFEFSSDLREITMHVWSPRADVPVKIRLSQQNGSATYETTAQTTVAAQWEELTFEISSEGFGTQWDEIRLFFDADGESGDGSANDTWYFDTMDVFGLDLATGGDMGGMIPVPLPQDFEDTSMDWNRAFTGFSGGEITVVENPHPDELNSSAWVAKKVKNQGQFWGGAFMNTQQVFSFDEDNHTISMKVWSPRPNVPVLLKVEQQNGVRDYEIAVNTTTSEEWEEMTWDMSGAGFEHQWDIITYIFDFAAGQIGDGSANFTWYFDDVVVNSGEIGTSTEPRENLPESFQLAQNYPNPFNPTTQIRYSIPESAPVLVEVFNVMGQRVAILQDGMQTAGWHTLTFDGSQLSSGLYLYRVQTQNYSATRKMLLMK